MTLRAGASAASLLLGSGLLGSGLLSGCAAPEAAEVCTTEHLATLPTVPAAGWLAVPVAIGQSDTVMVVDTGAETSIIADGQDTALRLQKDPHRTARLFGTGGGSVQVHDVIVPGLRIGERETGEMTMPVGRLVGGLTELDPPIAGLLGLDVLEPYDLDIDRPAGSFGIYLRTGCETDRPAWTGRATRIGLERTTNNLLLMPVVLDGVRLEAVVDTGARRTMISRGATSRLGIDLSALASEPATMSEGVDGKTGHGHLHRFGRVQIGAMTFHDVRIDVGSTDLGTGDMLLGEDFFRHFRVWLSPSTATAFVALPARRAGGS